MSLETMVKGGYPSDELYAEWLAEWLSTSSLDQGTFLINKACDWQIEKDMLICEQLAAKHLVSGGREYGNDIGPAIEECAEAIRT